ncbi:DUF1214 domain-containing protein, partial [Campylobacter fetus subsp. venerealis]
GLKYNQDGGFTVYIQHGTPSNVDEKSNWLPAPDEPFYLMLRVYGPETSALEGSWEPPGIVKND